MPTSEQLRMLREGHVPYEIKEFAADTVLLDKLRNTKLKNVALEAFLVHGRVLLDFYYAKPFNRRPTDVFAFQFIEGGEPRWDEIAPREEAPGLFGHSVDDLYNKISTSLGHLTITRLAKAAWGYPVLGQGLMTLTTRWRQNLTADSLAALVQGEQLEADRSAGKAQTPGRCRTYGRSRRR
jgi:hypothetical protein